jgi:hypothetical protein
MEDAVMQEEYPRQQQRAAICYRQWREQLQAGGDVELPATVRQMEKQAQQIWAAVYDQAKQAGVDDPAAIAYRALEEYLLYREYDETKSITLDVIRPGKYASKSGDVKWTAERQRKLLASMDKAAENGVLPTLRYGDHDLNRVVGWILDVYEEEADDGGEPWIKARPFFTDTEVRQKVYTGEIRYLSAEIRPAFTTQGVEYEEFLQSVVLLDPELLPNNYPAVPRSKVVVAASRSGGDEKALLFEGGAVTGGEEMGDEPNEFSVDDVLSAISKVTDSVGSLASSVSEIKESVETMSGAIGDVRTRLSALEQTAESENEVETELSSFAENEEGYVACLSAGQRGDLAKGLRELDADARKGAMLILRHLPRTPMEEQTFSGPGAPSEPEQNKGVEKFSAANCPEDEREKAKLRGESVKMLRSEVDADKLPDGITIQEKAVELSMAKYPHLWADQT